MLRSLYSETVVLDRKINIVSRELFTKRIIDYILDMFELYNALSTEDDLEKTTNTKRKMLAILDKINFVIIVSVGDNVMSTRRAMRIGEISLELRRTLGE